MNRNPVVCIDASTALAAVLQNDPSHVTALNYLAQLAAQNGTLCAPALFTYECDSVIRLQVFRGTLNETEAQSARALLHALGVSTEYAPADGDRALQIASDYDQPRAYDAAYAAHAEARGIEFVTTDTPFFDAVNGGDRPRNKPPLSFVKLLT